MEIKLVRSNLTNNTQFEPIKNLGQSVRLASLTEDAEIFSTITEIQVTATSIAVKVGDRLNVNGQLLTISDDLSAGATTLYVDQVTLDFYLEANASIKIDYNNLFEQYQRKTEGTIGTFGVSATGIGKNAQQEVTNGNLHDELGSELAINGDFASGSGWFGSNKNIADGVLTLTVVGGVMASCARGITYTSGKYYQMTSIVSGTGGSVRFLDNSSNLGGLTATDSATTLTAEKQTVTFDFVANANSNVINMSRNTNSGDYSVFIDDITVKEIGVYNDWESSNDTSGKWTIQNNKASVNCTSNSLFKNTPSSLSNNISYETIYTVSDFVSGSVTIRLGSGSGAGTARNANGTYTEIITSNTSSLSEVNFEANVSSGFNGSISRISVKEVGVEINDFIDDDTFATASNTTLATSESTKVYVDGKVGASDSLQEVTDIGNTTTQDIIVNNLTAASPSVPQNGPKLLSKGTIWNSGLGNKTTEGGMQIAPDTNNANPSISKLSFLVGTDNSAATEQMYITSQGQFNILGGGDFAGTSLDDLNSVLIRNTETAGSSAPKNSNKLVFEGKFWNSAQGSKTNQGYIQLLSTTNNANPFINRLGFFTQEGVNGGSYTEQVSIVNNGNVGIGETTPSEKLDVNGTVKATNLKISGSEVDFTGLPTSDPGVAGRLYIDDTFIKISEG